jgi:hypothetical protein
MPTWPLASTEPSRHWKKKQHMPGKKKQHMPAIDKTAAGWMAIYETGKFGHKEMGVERSFETLLKVNQKDGFDCPSCAWPDPKPLVHSVAE